MSEVLLTVRQLMPISVKEVSLERGYGGSIRNVAGRKWLEETLQRQIGPNIRQRTGGHPDKEKVTKSPHQSFY